MTESELLKRISAYTEVIDNLKERSEKGEDVENQLNSFREWIDELLKELYKILRKK